MLERPDQGLPSTSLRTFDRARATTQRADLGGEPLKSGCDVVADGDHATSKVMEPCKEVVSVADAKFAPPILLMTMKPKPAMACE